MNQAIADIVPLGLAIALSPFPIIATILMLLSPRAKANGGAFLASWVLGTLIVVSVFTIVFSVVEHSASNDANALASVLRIALGVVLLILAVRKWLQGRRDGAEPKLPNWMSSITTTTPPRAFVTGLLLSGANPKNVLIAVAAGIAIGHAELDVAMTIVSVALYIVIGSATVIIPVVAHALFSTRLTEPLESLERWLVRNSTILMALILLIFGFILIGNGIEEL